MNFNDAYELTAVIEAESREYAIDRVFDNAGDGLYKIMLVHKQTGKKFIVDSELSWNMRLMFPLPNGNRFSALSKRLDGKL